MNETLALLFGLRRRVARRAYIGWGLLLAAVKFGTDTGIVYGFSHKTWSPLGYVLPSLILRNEATGAVPQVMHVLLIALAMPFLWIGLSMSVRRAADAGLSPWLGAAFLVPGLNYLCIAFLCVMPSKAEARWDPPRIAGVYRQPGGDDPGTPAPASKVELPSGLKSALLGILVSILMGLGMLWISVYGLGTYGMALFFATPFAMGATTAALYNANVNRGLGNTVGLAIVGTVLTGSIFLLFALEGVLCLAMAMPIATIVSIVGAVIGWAIVTGRRSGAAAPAYMALALPALALGESRLAVPEVHDVTTTIEIDAPPERVWPNVIGFSDLPEPPEWEYRAGIAYPMRAKIDGTGVGSVRRCEFSTGAFVEPITAWDPPNRLAFDVTQEPPSMTEWSPYHDVQAPHLEGYMKSKGGEFRLVRLAGDRTRLEGTTHYTLAIYPEVYWRSYAEVLLHGIHTRVLRHIKHLSE